MSPDEVSRRLERGYGVWLAEAEVMTGMMIVKAVQEYRADRGDREQKARHEPCGAEAVS